MIDSVRMFQMVSQGFCCSQILLSLALETQGKENQE